MTPFKIFCAIFFLISISGCVTEVSQPAVPPPTFKCMDQACREAMMRAEQYLNHQKTAQGQDAEGQSSGQKLAW